MTKKLSSKASGCVEAAIGLGPEDTSRIMELHQLYADAGLTSDQAISKAANDLIAELQEEAADITKAVAPMLEAPVITPADAAKADAAIEAMAPQFSNAPDDDRLIAVHNLTESNLLHAAKMGGIAVPSLAVTPAAMPLDNFGEITLLAPKSLVDPKAGAKVFGADIYSPRYPSVERELDRKQESALYKMLEPAIKRFNLRAPDRDDIAGSGDRTLTESLAMQAQFLADNGMEPAVVMRKADLDDRRIERLKSFGVTDAHLAMTDRFDLRNNPEFEKAAVAERLDVYRQEGGELQIKLGEKLKRDPEAQRKVASDLAFEVVAAAELKAKPTNDEYATRVSLEEQIDEAGLRDAYAAHVTAWLGRITKSERIPQGYTDSGNRKYTPHTLDNVVKILKKILRGGESFNYGAGSLRALVTPEFKSIAAIKAGRGHLISVADFDKVKDEINRDLNDLGDSLGLDTDNAKDFLEIAATRNMLAAERELGVELTDDQRKAAGEFLTKLRGLPTAYFEAKHLRAVGIDEFAAAVIPANTGAKARKALADAGVRVFEYDKAADRPAAVTEATREVGVQFSNIGERAKTADLMALSSAKAAIATGQDAEVVRRDTGWHQGPDQKWRFEISDVDARPQWPGNFEAAIMKAYSVGWELSGNQLYKTRVDDVLVHPALFAAYPSIGSIEVQMMPAGRKAKGSVMRAEIDGKEADTVIQVREDLSADEWISVLLHEIQHGIQHIEGFATGWSSGGPFMTGMRDAVIKANAEQLRRSNFYDQKNPFSSPNNLLTEDEIQAMAERNADDLSQRNDVYRRVAGEVEARNTQARRNMTAEELRATPPSATADVPDSDVIVVFNGKEMASAPMPANAAAPEPVILPDRSAIDGTPGDVLWSQAAYHGAPHRGIKQFTTDAMGTGEGAQAFGWGLYFASKKEIAEFYRESLSPRGAGLVEKALGVPEDQARALWAGVEKAEAGDLAGARRIVEYRSAALRKMPDADRNTLLDRAIAAARDGSGQTYKVDIPDDTDMLLWDKPLSEQGSALLSALRDVAYDPKMAPRWTTGAMGERRFIEPGRAMIIALDGAKPVGEWEKSGAGMSFNVNGLSVGMVFQARGKWFADPMMPGKTASQFDTQDEARAHLEKTFSPDAARLDGSAIYAKLSTWLGGDREASLALLRAGIKGIKYLDGTSRNAGDGSFNYVIFSGDDVAIKEVFYSNRAQFAGKDLPSETRTQKTRRVAQDYFLRAKVVQDVLIGSGGTVGEAQDVYRAEERSYGRIQAQLEDFAKRWVKPMLEKAVAAGVELDELALYAYAKHAPERNTHIDKINPAMQGAGSGMSDKDAAKIVADVQASGKAQVMEDLRQDMLAITAATRRVMLDDGLITQEDYDGMEAAYQDYVPLRGLENVDDSGRPKPGTGRGVNLRGKETVAALGRRSRASDIVENIIRDYERVVIRGERNGIAKTLLDLVTTNPDPDLWEVDATKSNRTLSKTTGLVQSSASIDSGEDTIGVKVGGRQVYIKIKDPLLLRAMKQAAKDESGEFQSMLAQSLGVYNTWLRNTLTRYNPVFGVVNAIRDVQAGAVATLDKLGAKGLKLYAQHYRAALAASTRNEFDALGKAGALIGGQSPKSGTTVGLFQFGDPVMDKWFEEYRAAGGTTAGWFMRDVETINTDIRQMLVAAGATPRTAGERITGSTAWQAGKSLLRYVELFGSASENAGRVAAYRAAREMGRSPAEAASIAKNLTTNFNRKGEWGTALSSAYLFFNAAVQGTARVLEALKNRRVQALMAGVTSTAAMMAVIGASWGGDDDDGQAYWDKIPQHEKERNFIIMLPPGSQHDGAQTVGTMGRYIKVPMPYGFNVFATLGYLMADATRHQIDPMRGITPAKAAAHLVSAVAGSYNPMGGAFDVTDPVAVGMAVAPTIVDAGIMLGAGVNSFGTPVGPKGSPFDSRPDSERFTVSQGGGASQAVARWLNEHTGGNRARSGAIDVMPGTLDNIVSMAGGGAGRFAWDVFVNMPTKLASKDEDAVFRYRDLPFLRNLAGQVDENVDRSLFYERMDEVLKEARTAKNEMKLGITVKYDPRSRAMQSIGKMADDYSGLMTDLRKEDLAIVNDPGLTADERKAQRKDVERRRNEFVREFNRAFLETERDLARGSFDKE